MAGIGGSCGGAYVEFVNELTNMTFRYQEFDASKLCLDSNNDSGADGVICNLVK